MKEKILVVDDDEGVRQVLGQSLQESSYSVSNADSGERAVAAVREGSFDLVILDMVLPRVDGLEVLKEITALRPEVPVVMITGYASVETAIKAMKMGAVDYVVKPFRMEEVELVVAKALERSHLRRENVYLRRQLESTYGVHNIVGQSPEMRRIFALIEQVASARSTVLITGGSGTGKELIAKALHYNGERRKQPFVSVNCGGIPDTLLEDELFGHVKGAFTDAVADRPGRFEAADSGTLFLDEIGNMSMGLQIKLLRVLQEREFIPLGGARKISVNVRIIAATNIDLKKMMEEGRFREDLYYRLNVIHIQLPPLRERREDIPLLMHHFLNKYCREMNVSVKRFLPDAVKVLSEFSWPGNVRQLENVIERAVALSFGKEELGREDLPREVLDEGMVDVPMVHVGGDGFSLDEVLATYEQRMLCQALEHAGWVKTRAAELLKIKRTTLIEKMKRLGIPLKGAGERPLADRLEDSGQPAAAVAGVQDSGSTRN
ncbi:MAG TPA: sigma-54 dependent transcriptional regulator [Candidatus Polarisedimenticolia bacterium]|nr:sigma-54 dependent transcriptional regulator [Candidatus Polarisedimenticolia bacterium]